jgi:hypothetical protein
VGILTLCHSYLKPYCTGRKTAFFQWVFKLIGQQERFGAFRPAWDIKIPSALELWERERVNINYLTESSRRGQFDALLNAL